ncbi:MAG: Ras family protein [Thermoplasmata archaeon]|nr:Ras family protein [Thermoplasmata archaeon]
MEDGETLWKIGVIGERGVGKTSLINRFVYDSFTNSSSGEFTSQFIKKKVDCGEKCVETLLMEIDPKNLSPRKIIGTKAMIIIGDVTNIDTIDSMEKLGERIQEINPKTKLIFIANKSDLKYMAQYWVDEVKCIAEKYNGIVYGVVSAKTGENVKEGFSFMCHKIIKLSV